MTITNNPLVSICIPTYNKAQYIRKTLESIVSQTYKNIEIIVVDNASSDNTENIVREYVKKYGVKYFRNIKNIGLENWNKCIELSSGEYIAMYHSDDVYDKKIVEKEVNVLMQDERIGAVFTRGYYINKNDKIIREREFPPIFNINQKIKTLNFNEGFQAFLDYGCFLLCSSAMVRKRVYNDIGNFNCKEWCYAVDFDMWIRILLKYKIAVINEPLVRYRVYNEQGTTIAIQNIINEPEEYKILDKYLSFVTSEKTEGKIKTFNISKYKSRRKKEQLKFTIRTFCKYPDKSFDSFKNLAKINLLYRIIFIVFQILKNVYFISRNLILLGIKLKHRLKY